MYVTCYSIIILCKTKLVIEISYLEWYYDIVKITYHDQ